MKNLHRVPRIAAALLTGWESRTDLPNHTIYRPQRWPATPVPVYLWGNGGCSDNGLSHAAYLRQIASNGYLVIALGAPRQQAPRASAPPAGAGGPPRAGAGAPPPGAAPAGAGAAPRAGAGGPPPGNDPTTPAQLLEGLDWATRENARADSDLRGHLDLTRVAVGGHSCGGLQALAISHDPRIATTLVLDSGIYIRPGGRSGVAIDKTQLLRLHGPVFYLTGGPSDIAHENALDDFEKLQHVPVVMASLPVGHGGTFSAPDGGDWARVTLRWLDWQLKRDAEASKEFVGPSCRLCTDTRWTVKQKNLPQTTGPAATAGK
jgi:uncharacterized protein